MVDLIASDRRVGPAIDLTWPRGSVGEGTIERYSGANLQV